MSDSEEEFYDSRTIKPDVVVKEEPLLYYFGPFLSPVAATPAQWTAYTKHRLGANAEHNNVFDRGKRSIGDTVALIEAELGLANSTLQKCIYILERYVVRDDVNPRDADTLVRIYSPAVPKYIDVHIKYHSRSRFYSVEWFYSLGYKICNRISASSNTYSAPDTDGPVSMLHSRGGWQSICWGFYDNGDGNYGPRWRPVEVADMDLHEEAVLDVHEALFGPIDTPPSDDADALLAYRRKLVATVRLLFAALGMNYEVACSEEEEDKPPGEFVLEAISDKWVARGIREACGFQLQRDPEEAERGKEERRDHASGGSNGYDDDEDEDEWF